MANIQGSVGNIVVTAGNVTGRLDCISGPVDDMAEPLSYFLGNMDSLPFFKLNSNQLST